MLTLKECLLAGLKPVGGTSDITAYGEGYDENLHSLMQTFWDMFGLGQITQNVTCTICSCVTTRVESFSKLLLQFPESHHEATPMNQKCTLNSLIEYHLGQEDLPDYDCQTCGRRTLATRRVQISWYPVIFCWMMTPESFWQSTILYATWICVLFWNYMKEWWIWNTTSLPPCTTSQVKLMMAILHGGEQKSNFEKLVQVWRWHCQFGKVCEREH